MPVCRCLSSTWCVTRRTAAATVKCWLATRRSTESASALPASTWWWQSSSSTWSPARTSGRWYTMGQFVSISPNTSSSSGFFCVVVFLCTLAFCEGPKLRAEMYCTARSPTWDRYLCHDITVTSVVRARLRRLLLFCWRLWCAKSSCSDSLRFFRKFL